MGSAAQGLPPGFNALVEVIAQVKALGYDGKDANQVLERLLKSIRTRPNDDSVLKTLQKLLSS